MKKLVFGVVLLIFASCSESSQQKVDDAVSKSSDSLKSKLNKLNDTLREGARDVINKIPKVKVEIERTIPISLQWISFEEAKGSATIANEKDGWRTIKGEQNNTANEFLKIDGKIRRTDQFNVAFEGTIVTYIKSNNGGKPCEKTGKFNFLKKGDRPYYRLQQMENCAGGRLVDYVDLFELDKVL